MSVNAYATLIAAARSGKSRLKEADINAALMPLVWPNGKDGLPPGEWLDRDEAFDALADVPLAIENLMSDAVMELAIDPSYEQQSVHTVMYAHGINRYAFDLVHAEEDANETGNRTDPERLRGGPKIAFAILKEAGAEPALTTDPKGDFCAREGTRLVVSVPKTELEIE